MGRPIKKQFFGSLTKNQAKLAGGTTGVGGEGIASVAAQPGNVGSMRTGTYAIPAASIGAPQIAGGRKPTLNAVVSASNTYGVTVVTAGSGYTSAPTITFNASITTSTATGSAVPIATLTSNRPDTISFTSRIIGGTAQTAGDIIKQEGSRRYLIQNSDGKGICKLVTTATGSLIVGQMNIVATDWNGSTYFVSKLTAHKAVLVRSTASTAFLVGNGISTRWTLAAATGTVVTIANTI